VNPRRLDAVLERGFRTVLRNRTLVLLAAAFSVVVVAVAALGSGGPGGFAPLVLDLLLPVEVLVPALSIAFGYRSVLGDEERGERDVQRTFPATALEYVGGVLLGRSAVLVPVVGGCLLLAGVLVPLLQPDPPTVVATHSAGDSPLLYLRFVLLTAAYAVVTLAAAVAVSAVARSTREAVVLAVALLVTVVVGIDAGAVATLAAFGPESAPVLAALSPNGAYRGLVLELVVAPTGTEGPRAASPLLSALSLLAWLGASGLVAVVGAD
jgi:ABC-2 type transport system permease protein